MMFHERLQRTIRQLRAGYFPNGAQRVVLRWRDGAFYRLTVIPGGATYAFDNIAAQYFDRPHPLSDTLYQRAPR